MLIFPRTNLLHSVRFKAERNIKDLVLISDASAVASFIRLFDAIATVANGVDPTDETNYLTMVDKFVIYCTVWCCGGALDTKERTQLDAFIRDIESQFPPVQSVYDFFIDPVKKEWLSWESDKVSDAWRAPPNTSFSKLLVPTVDTVRIQWMMSALIKNRVRPNYMSASRYLIVLNYVVVYAFRAKF